MTTETYTLNGNTLIQQPEMKKPEWEGKFYMNLPYIESDAKWELYQINLKEYNEQKAKCKRYDISGNIPPHWEVEGYIIKENEFELIHGFGFEDSEPLAIPILKEGNDNRDEQDEFEKLFNEFIEFSIPTFKNASALSSIGKCDEELREIANEINHGHTPSDLKTEYVDAIMCLLDSLARAGITIKELKEAFKIKLEINKSRTWVKNDDNTYSHKKDHKLTIGLALLKTKQVSKPPTDESYTPF